MLCSSAVVKPTFLCSRFTEFGKGFSLLSCFGLSSTIEILGCFPSCCYLYFPSWAVSHVTSVRLQILIRTYITASTAGGRFDVENFWWPGDLFPLGCLFLAHWSLVLSRGVGSYCLMQGPGADVGWWRAESYRSTKKRHEFMYWYKTMYSFVGVTFTTYIPLYNWPNETTNKEHKQCP